MEVPLRHILIALLQIHVFYSSDEENAFTLTQMHWFHDESLIVLFFVELLPEIIHLLREDPGLREEIIVVWEHFSHSHEISTEIILSSQLIHPRIVINALVWLQFGELFGCCPGYIAPVYIPIAILIVHHLVAQLFEGLAHNHVPYFGRAQVQKRLLFLWTLLIIIIILVLKALHSQGINTGAIDIV